MKFYKSYRKYLFKRDTFFSIAAVFLVIGLLSLVPLNTQFLNPIKTALSDFDFNDIAYAKLGKNNRTPIDQRIVIVNVGNADRAQIAGMIEKVSAAKPKVIGLDVRFDAPRDPRADSLLIQILQATPHLVAASWINWNNKASIEQRGFLKNNIHSFGYVNFIGEDQGTIRYFSPREEQNGQQYLSFAAALVKEGNPEAYQKLMKRHHETEQIHYTRKANQYPVVNCDEVLNDAVEGSVFANKYVILGYVNNAETDAEDKHFTPMNSQFAGKSLPDMNGAVIHANIISMLLDHNYVKKVPGWLNWIFVLFIAWLHVTLFIRYYIEDHLWFHLVAKLAQIISAIFFVYLGIILFHAFGLKLDMKVSLIVIILAIDVIYFYEAFALWLHKKIGFRTIFNHKPH